MDLNEVWNDVLLIDSTVDSKEDIRNYFPIETIIENFLSAEFLKEKKDIYKRKLHSLKIRMSETTNEEGYTPLDISGFQGDYKQVQLFLHYTQNPEKKSKVLELAKNSIVRSTIIDLHKCAQKGKKEDFDYLLKCGEKINERKTIKAQAPIHFSVDHASKSKDEGLLEFVIESGAEINTDDCNGRTPLHYASEIGNISVVQKLIQANASLNFQSNKGHTALHIAALHNQSEVIKCLLETQEDDFTKKKEKDMIPVYLSNIKDNDHCTPLLLAAKKGHVEALSTILAHSEKTGRLKEVLMAVDSRNWNALHFTTYNGHIEATKLLRKYDADYSPFDEVTDIEKKKLEAKNGTPKIDSKRDEKAFGRSYTAKDRQVQKPVTNKLPPQKFTKSLRASRNSQGKTPFEIAKNSEVKFALESTFS